MSILKNIFKTSLIFVAFTTINCANAQTDYQKIYDDYINSDAIGGEKSILSQIDKHTSRFFILISYYIDSNNIMYDKTGAIKYLKLNDVALRKFKSKNGPFLGEFYKHEQNYELHGKESSLLEGYLYRYLANYYYLLFKLDKEQLKAYELDTDFTFLEERFLEWYNRSKKARGDDSLLHGIRIHMGAQWATAALYLSELTKNEQNKKIYQSFLKRYNQQLQINIKEEEKNKKQIYVWNSTYNNAFTDKLKERYTNKGKETIIQDISHGNHVVEYILSAYNLGYGDWNENSIQRLSNTLKFIIYKPQNKTFTNYVNGNEPPNDNKNISEIKLSDGWMKLIKYDRSLFGLYQENFLIYQNQLKAKHYFNQILANLVTVE